MGEKWEVIWIAKESGCRYKPGQLEKIFAIVSGGGAAGPRALMDEFLPKGLALAPQMAYGLNCPACNACVPLRIRIQDYEFSKRERYILRNNEDLVFRFTGKPEADEHHKLFQKYCADRHPEGDESKWPLSTFQMFMQGHSGCLEVRGKTGKLLAAAVYDESGPMVYGYSTFYDPEQSTARRSLGTLCTLKLIQLAKDCGKDHLYAGHWVKGSAKLDYKRRYQNLEALTENGWIAFDPARHTAGPDLRKSIPADAKHKFIAAPNRNPSLL